MEAATWNGTNILQTSKKLGLRTEASNRFEKQLHPRLALQAQRLAARLMVELCGARMVPGTVDVAAPEPEPHRVVLRSERDSTRLLGEHVEPEESQAILERLGFGVERRDGELEAEVPYWRHYDVYREADLIEEVARVHGLQRLPATLPGAPRRGRGAVAAAEAAARDRGPAARRRPQRDRDVQLHLARGGAPAARPARRPARAGAAVANPLSEEQSVMRTTLVPGLLEVARHNVARDMPDLKLFETGRVFFSNGPTSCRTSGCTSAILLTGDFEPRDAGAAGRAGRLLHGEGRAGRRCSTRSACAGGWSPAARRSCIRAARPRWSWTRARPAGSASCILRWRPTSASASWSARPSCWSSTSAWCCRWRSGSSAATRT